MKIEDAIEKFDRSLNQTTDQKERKIKMRFSNILHELKTKDLAPIEISRLEEELDDIFAAAELDDPGNLKLQLDQFIDSLRKNFSLIPEGFCAGKGTVMGIITGILILAVSMAYTTSILKFYAPLGGMVVGMIIGSLCDLQAKKKGRTLLTKMY